LTIYTDIIPLNQPNQTNKALLSQAGVSSTYNANNTHRALHPTIQVLVFWFQVSQ